MFHVHLVYIQAKVLSSKAIAGKVLSFWLAAKSKEFALRDGASELDGAVWTCVWAYCALLKDLEEFPFLLSADQARAVQEHGLLHLRTYAWLRTQSSLAGRGAPNKSLWLMLPKHHHLQHTLSTSFKERVNPLYFALMSAESFVGSIGRSCRILGLKKHCMFFLRKRCYMILQCRLL